MRFLVFSDIHGNQYAWRTFLNTVDSISYDTAVFLGDIFGYYYGQREVVEGLASFENLIWLAGNHDRYFCDMLKNPEMTDGLVERYGSSYSRMAEDKPFFEKFLIGRASSCEMEAEGMNILFCHGTPDNPENGRVYPRDEWSPEMCLGYDVVICGHTHFRMERRYGAKLWLNAGSLGQPRDGGRSCCMLFDTKSMKHGYVDIVYDKAALFKEIAVNDPQLLKLRDVLERDRS